MIKVWSQFKAEILFSLLIFGLFAISTRMQPLIPVEIAVVALEPEVETEVSNVPDFAAILDVELKKQAFFAYIRPHIDQENRDILRQRETLEEIQAKVLSGRTISSRDVQVIRGLSLTYELEGDNLESPAHLRRLLKRLDVIPVSLVLAQAANESAWGTSRFARFGYNFFGQWCYTEGCGIIPSRRSAGDNHEVQRFEGVEGSVHAYFMNLNTFQSYEILRDIRQLLRDQDRGIDGISLTEGLESYSERGEEYIWELQSMMYSNGLNLLDEV